MELNKGDTLYHARIIPEQGIFDVNEIKIRTVADTWFAGTEKHSKQAFLFSCNRVDKDIFWDRNDALEKVKNAELAAD